MAPPADSTNGRGSGARVGGSWLRSPFGGGFRVASPLLVLPAVLFLLAFFVFPLMFNASAGIAGRRAQATYGQLLSDPFYQRVIVETFALNLIVALICLLLGYPVAYFMTRHAGRWRSFLTFMLIAPLLTSIIMRTYGWRVLFARRGLVNEALLALGLIDGPLNFMQGPGVAVAALVHVMVPFAILSIAASLDGIDRRLDEAAAILGAGAFTTFRRVTLPLSIEGIATAFILVFMLANGSFVTFLLLGGNIQTLPLLIYQQFNTTRNFEIASSLGNILIVVAVVCLILQLRFIRRKDVV